MNRDNALLCCAAIVLVAVATFAQSNQPPVNWKGLPAPFHTPAVRNNPEVVSRPEGAQVRVPSGFKVEEYMSGFVRPRFMMLGPGNEVLMSDSGSREVKGAVYVLKNGTKTPIIEGLDRPYGLALKGDWLYVASTLSLQRYKYDAKTMKVTGAGEEIVPLKEAEGGHWTRSIVFNRDGTKLYLSVGSGSNIDLGEPANRAALHRYNPDGTGHETVATGLRNVIGLRLHPGTDDVWAAIQERDGLGDDLVPDYITRIREGAFYGWPIAYIGPNAEPRHKDVDMAKVKSTQYPDVLLGAHVAVLDILFYTGKMFPEKYRGGMFAAQHGSWNRAGRVGYNLVFIPFKDRKPTAGPEDFLSGWMLDPSKKEVWGRPVGLLQMPDGSLLVSDDGGKKIWRISFAGGTSTQ